MDLIKDLLKSGWSIKVSNKKNKKYDVFNSENKYITSFGDKRYEHYFDLLGHYSNLNHNDETRLKNFRNRFRSKYEANKNNPESALFWSWNLLW